MKRYNNLKIQYFAVFIFLALMLFMKPDTVFAKVGGGNSSWGYDKTSLINAKEFDSGFIGQGRIADSFDDVPENMRQFSLGYKADFMQAGGTDANAAWENYSSGGNQTYSITGKALLIAFPKIITFVESAAIDRRTVSYATGYLYMMVDSDSLKEQMQINSGLAAQELMPLFFTNKQTGKGEGEMLFSLPAFNMYLPLSNIKKGGAYYSQNSTKTNAKDKMVEICSAGKQDVENWSNWNDGSGFIVGENTILPSSLKWSTIFTIGEMQENFRNTTGQAFNEERSLGAIYPTSATQLKSDINDIRSKYPAFADYVGPVTMINSGQIQYGYYGFKENTTAIGGKITNFWDINGLVSREWTQDINTARIVKGEKLLQAAYNALTAGGSLNILDPNRNKISAQQMAGIYDSIAASAEDAGSKVNFIQYGSKSLVPRYQWACELGAVPNNTIDGVFPKDTQPKTTHERDRNLYKLLDYKINTSSAILRSHSLTSMFSDYASSTYDSLPEQDKIESTLIYLTFDPIFVPLIASHNSNVRKYIGTGVDSIKKLNELGKTDYKSWKKCVLQIGNHLFSHSLVSTPPYIGWSSQAAFLGTTGGKTFYQIESVGISVVMSPLSPVYEDLLVSNSYNSQSVDTSLGENGATGSTFNYPTSRSYIDWATENLSGLNMTGLKKGGTNNPENPNTTKMKNLSGKQFDIYCGIRSISGAGQLAPDTDNIAAVGRSAGGKGTSNNSQIRTYSQNPAQHKFTTVFFVGRIPEADSEVEVKVGDMVPTVFASFNKFDLVWDAGFDDNASGRATVSINMSENKGTAQSALSSAIYAFSGEYNGKGTHLYKMNPALVRNQLLKCSFRYSL